MFKNTGLNLFRNLSQTQWNLLFTVPSLLIYLSILSLLHPTKTARRRLVISSVWISHWQAPSAQIILIPQRESPDAQWVTKVQCAVGLCLGKPESSQKCKQEALGNSAQERLQVFVSQNPRQRQEALLLPHTAGASRRWAVSENSSGR